MNAGFWVVNYWPTDYWAEDYWADRSGGNATRNYWRKRGLIFSMIRRRKIWQ